VHLDALRGLAAFSVLLNHWRDALFVDYSDLGNHNPLMAFTYLITGLGRQWVIVFFVMSGYLVGGSVLRTLRSQTWSWRDYLLARLTRLYVVLIPALLLGSCLDWVGLHIRNSSDLYSGHSGMHSLTVDVHSRLNLPTFVCNSVFLQTLVIPASHGWQAPTLGTNGPLWSLSNEFWYYLAFPLLALLIAGVEPLWARITYGIGLALWGWLVGAGIVLLGIPWLFGVLIHYLPVMPPLRSWVRVLFMLTAVGLLGGSLLLGRLFPGLTFDLLLGVGVAVAIWLILHCATSSLPRWYVIVAQRMARSSYTLYLAHFPLLILLKALLDLPRSNLNWHSLWEAFAVLLVIFVYAQLVYEGFEKNTDRVRKWIKLATRRPQTVAAD